MSIMNRLIENLFWGDVLNKEALFHCADEVIREAVGRILEIGLNRQKESFLSGGSLQWVRFRFSLFSLSQ